MNLQGLTQIQAAVKIAKENNNILVIKDATKLMIKARILSSNKSWTALNTALSRQGSFIKSGPGEYTLTGFCKFCGEKL